MAGLTHPFDPDALYVLDEDGNVRVVKGDRFGVFTGEGVHLSGEIREADPQLCNWVSNNPDPAGQLAPSRLAGRDKGGFD